VVARAVDEQVRRGERDRGAERGGGLPHPVQARVDQGEELARRRRECVVVEDGRILDRGLEVVDQVDRRLIQGKTTTPLSRMAIGVAFVWR